MASVTNIASELSTEELEDRLLRAVLSLDDSGRLPARLTDPVRRYRRAQHELQTHKRNSLLLSNAEYAEVGTTAAALRSRIVDLCLQTKVF